MLWIGKTKERILRCSPQQEKEYAHGPDPVFLLLAFPSLHVGQFAGLQDCYKLFPAARRTRYTARVGRRYSSSRLAVGKPNPPRRILCARWASLIWKVHPKACRLHRGNQQTVGYGAERLENSGSEELPWRLRPSSPWDTSYHRSFLSSHRDSPVFTSVPFSFWGTPSPVPDFGHVLAVLIDVFLVRDQLILELLLQVDALVAALRQAIDGVHHQVETIQFV